MERDQYVSVVTLFHYLIFSLFHCSNSSERTVIEEANKTRGAPDHNSYQRTHLAKP